MSACAPSCASNFSTRRPRITAKSANPWSARAAVSSLLEILAITARGDSRSDVLKELERHVNVLKEYQSKTGVDPGRLKSLMSNLRQAARRLVDRRRQFHGAAARLGVPERHQASQRHPRRHLRFRFAGLFVLAEPSGGSARRRVRQLAGADPAVVRQHRRTAVADPAKRQAQVRKSRCGGIFQLQFDRETPCQLVRITLPPTPILFPEISGNQHRCTIRFLNWTDATTPSRARRDGCAVSVDLLRLIGTRVLDGHDRQMSHLPARRGMVGGIACTARSAAIAAGSSISAPGSPNSTRFQTIPARGRGSARRSTEDSLTRAA